MHAEVIDYYSTSHLHKYIMKILADLLSFFHILYLISFILFLAVNINAYLKQIKVVSSAVKKYRIFTLVTNTIYIFSL